MDEVEDDFNSSWVKFGDGQINIFVPHKLRVRLSTYGKLLAEVTTG